ncbi:MAG: hypothetical protein QOF02_3833, partial [Blastocatellia bacterium]|nr:hypothetical protein [Blastocatellia bacterium]
MQKAVEPPSKKNDDSSDELASLFDDGTKLSSATQSPPLPTTPHDYPPLPIAPAKDFNKRANSLERDALPQGLFPGSSKKIYDALYLRTRGAIVPRNKVRASRRDFLTWTGIKNLKTVDGHIRYLMSVGLIVRHWELGSNEGSEYEVRLPEESPRLPTSPHHSPPLPTSQKTGSGDTQFLGSGGEGQTVDLNTTSEIPKTLIKTKEEKLDDDAALAPLNSALKQAVKELTGKELSTSEAEKWRELADILITELKIAAARTTISSVPAFLTEHLRRRLFKKDKGEMDAQAAQSP